MDILLIVVAGIVGLITVFLAFAYCPFGKKERPPLEVDEDGYLPIPQFLSHRKGRIPLKDETPRVNEDIRCRFSFICSRKWEDLSNTASEDIKFCTHCEQAVYLAHTFEDLDEFAAQNKCAYYTGSSTGSPPRGFFLPMVGRLTPKKKSLKERFYQFFSGAIK